LTLHPTCRPQTSVQVITRLRVFVPNGRLLTQQTRLRELDRDRHREAGRIVGAVDRQPASSGARLSGPDLYGREHESRRPVRAGSVPAETRQPEPATGMLRDKAHPVWDVQAARGQRRSRGDHSGVSGRLFV
jgi:hypothetical protein